MLTKPKCISCGSKKNVVWVVESTVSLHPIRLCYVCIENLGMLMEYPAENEPLTEKLTL